MIDKKSNWPRGKICGGSSILNYMVYVRGNKEDYDEWSKKYKCKGWSYNDLIPIFKSYEKCIFNIKDKRDSAVRGFNGLQKISRKSDNEQFKLSKVFVEAAMKCGYKYNDDYNGISQDGVSYTQYNIDENGRRMTSFRAFVATLFNDKYNNYNIDILSNSQVTKVLCKNGDNNKKIAYGVQINNNKSQNIYINEENKGEIIISAGAVGTPHILLLSGIGDVEELKKHNIEIQANVPGVGQNLKDHIMQCFRVVFGDKINKEKSVLNSEIGLIGLYQLFKQYFVYGKGPVATTGLDAQIFTKSSIAKKDKLKSNDLQLVQVAIGEAADKKKAAESAMKYSNYDLVKDNFNDWEFKNKNISDEQKRNSILAVSMVVRPKSVGSIKLASSNPFDHPLIDPNYLDNEDDVKAYLEGWEILEKIYESQPFKAVGAEIIEPKKSSISTRKEWAEYVLRNWAQTIYHPVGTAKMSGDLKNDKYAVCSERLRVRGFKNLRCADASVAPEIIAGNTQGMCYIIGCKAAKMILQDWK